MDETEQARSLIIARRYKEAAVILDRLLSTQGKNDALWYLRGVASLRMKNYDAALECFERALLFDRKSSYYQIKGMAHFELFEMDEAIEAFVEALGAEPDNP
ncbi:MAG: tetratricopeptide repeat protein, partial [Candidatus Micrarchaeota archaeon]